MFFESIAIIVVILLMFIIFLREHRLEYAKTAGILMILPGTYAISCVVASVANRLLSVEQMHIIFYGVIVGLILACILIGCMANKIGKKKLRVLYVSVNGLFVLILTIIMLLKIPYPV